MQLTRFWPPFPSRMPTGRPSVVARSCSVVALRCNGGQLSDELAALELDDCPIRMVGLPDGKMLLLALGGGGIVRVDVSGTEAGSPRLTLHSGAACRMR